LLVGLAYGAALTYIGTRQEALLFHPSPLGAGDALPSGAGIHERQVKVPGATISVLELRLPNPRGVVFFLHGNVGNLQTWFVNTDLYRRANVDLVMMDYRGFGKSTGHIESEAQLHADVYAVWQAVADNYRGKPVVVYGRSLGTGLAARLAASIQPDLTLLVSPYESMLSLAQEHYPWVPTALVRYPLRSDEWLPLIRGPVQLIHGELDTLISPEHSMRLLPIARRARLQLIANAGHGDLQDFETYQASVREALEAVGRP
jgi:hypothetical protein